MLKGLNIGKIAKRSFRNSNYLIQTWDNSLDRWKSRLPSCVKLYEDAISTHEYEQTIHYYENPDNQLIIATLENNNKLTIDNSYFNSNSKDVHQIFNLSEHEFILDNFEIAKTSKDT